MQKMQKNLWFNVGQLLLSDRLQHKQHVLWFPGNFWYNSSHMVHTPISKPSSVFYMRPPLYLSGCNVLFMQDTNTFWRCVSSEPIAERSCRVPRPIAEQWGRHNPESMNDTTCLFFSVPLGFFNGIPLSLSIFLTRFLDMLMRMKERSESDINTERLLMKAFRKPTPPHTHYELLSKLVEGWGEAITPTESTICTEQTQNHLAISSTDEVNTHSI